MGGMPWDEHEIEMLRVIRKRMPPNKLATRKKLKNYFSYFGDRSESEIVKRVNKIVLGKEMISTRSHRGRQQNRRALTQLLGAIEREDRKSAADALVEIDGESRSPSRDPGDDIASDVVDADVIRVEPEDPFFTFKIVSGEKRKVALRDVLKRVFPDVNPPCANARGSTVIKNLHGAVKTSTHYFRGSPAAPSRVIDLENLQRLMVGLRGKFGSEIDRFLESDEYRRLQEALRQEEEEPPAQPSPAPIASPEPPAPIAPAPSPVERPRPVFEYTSDGKRVEVLAVAREAMPDLPAHTVNELILATQRDLIRKSMPHPICIARLASGARKMTADYLDFEALFRSLSNGVPAVRSFVEGPIYGEIAARLGSPESKPPLGVFVFRGRLPCVIVPPHLESDVMRIVPSTVVAEPEFDVLRSPEKTVIFFLPDRLAWSGRALEQDLEDPRGWPSAFKGPCLDRGKSEMIAAWFESPRDFLGRGLVVKKPHPEPSLPPPPDRAAPSEEHPPPAPMEVDAIAEGRAEPYEVKARCPSRSCGKIIYFPGGVAIVRCSACRCEYAVDALKVERLE